MGMVDQIYWAGWMESFRNIWFLLKQELFPFVNLFSILFFLVRNDNILSFISAVASELFNFLCKYQLTKIVSGRFLFVRIVLMTFSIKLSNYSSAVSCSFVSMVMQFAFCVRRHLKTSVGYNNLILGLLKSCSPHT